MGVEVGVGKEVVQAVEGWGRVAWALQARLVLLCK
jgi:hypothetical protein